MTFFKPLFIISVIFMLSCSTIEDDTLIQNEELPFDFDVRNKSDIYHSREEIIKKFMVLCNEFSEADYEIAGKSIEGENIYVFRFGNKLINKGKIVLESACHGWEDAGTEVSYQFINWILKSDEIIAKDILENNYILILPILNVDNYGKRRQNKRKFYEFDTISMSIPNGVDLNRNAPSGFGESGTDDPLNNYEYRGLYGGSEPEINAVIWILNQYKPDIYVNMHTGNEYVANLNPVEKSDMYLKVMNNYDLFRMQYNTSYRYRTIERILGGMIAYEAYTRKSSAWLMEVAHWDHLPEQYRDFEDIWFKNTLPLFLAFCYASR